MATKIIINRKGEFINRGRPCKVIIDGKESEPITTGNSGEYIVDPGVHTVQCKMRWFMSPELTVTINEGETKFLKAQSAMKLYGVLYIILLVGLFSPMIPALKNNDIVLWGRVVVTVIFLLYVIYYLTLGRKSSMILQPDTDNIFN